MVGNRLRGGICLGERIDLVQVLVFERGDDAGEVLLSGVEIPEELIGVEDGAFDGEGDVPIVAVEWLALAIDDERMCRGEHGSDADGEHGGR